MFNQVFIAVQVLAVLFAVYQISLSFFGWYRKKEQLTHPLNKSFAILVAAHNEEAVVGALLDNLLRLDYPRELFDVFVICDNCTDHTVKIVQQYAGVYAFERTNPSQRGKGYAIEWMLKEMWQLERQYDAVVMVDADNLVANDFLQYMNEDLCNGYRVVQAYLDTKNPHDSWVSAANAISYWFSNRLWQIPRFNLKLANFLGGTGMCFETKLLKEIGWGATSLVEDLEFSVRCILRDVYPKFNYDARVYDEKPITFRASCKQRLRWMQGHFDIIRRYFFQLIWQGIKTKNFVKIDAAIYISNAFVNLLIFIITMGLWIDLLRPEQHLTQVYELIPLPIALFIIIYGYLQLPIALMLEKVSWEMYFRLLQFPFFLFSWWPISLYAFFTQNNKKWSHTEHTRVIRLEEMKEVKNSYEKKSLTRSV